MSRSTPQERQAILDIIATHGPMPAFKVTEIVDFDQYILSSAIRKLSNDGLIRRVGFHSAHHGRKPIWEATGGMR